MNEQFDSPIAQLIVPYLENPKLSGDDDIGARCPFPDRDQFHSHGDSSPSFAVNIENGLWVCHGCGRGGGLKTLLRGLGLTRGQTDRMIDDVLPYMKKYKRKEQRRRENRFHRDQFLADTVLKESLLGVYDWKPHALVADGLKPKLLRELDVGYDFKKQRITFPIRDLYGNLAGLVGRATNSYEYPRYLMYIGKKRGKDGKWRPSDFGPEFDEIKEYRGYKIKKGTYLWNMHRVYPLMMKTEVPLIVVEGFRACIWLIQHGYWNTVALMGTGMSLEQQDMICRMSAHGVALWLDNDDKGSLATKVLGSRLSRAVNDLWVCNMPKEVKQPDDLTKFGLDEVFESRMRFIKWIRMKRGNSGG